MFQKKLSVTFIALFLLVAGLFFLYQSNINKTVFLDITADSPILVHADKQEKGVLVNKNSDNSYTFCLPSAFLYQAKTIQLENLNNNNVQLKFYSQQKKDGDKVIKFSIDVEKIIGNNVFYNKDKQTAWFERPYLLDITAEKNKELSLAIQYKTKFQLRNTSLPIFVTSFFLLLGSIILLLACWYKEIEEQLFIIKDFFKKIADNYTGNIIKYISICLGLVLVISSAFFILYDANWILGDDIQFTTPIMNDTMISMCVAPSIGRFFPLAFQEFNLLLLFSMVEPSGFYFLSCLEFIITALFFTLFLKDLSVTYKQTITYFWCVVFLFCLILSGSFLYVFMEVIFSERNLLCLIALFMCFYYKGIKNENLLYILIASFFAVLSFYYKEPVFGIFIVFCLCPFIFDYNNVSKQHKVFSAVIFINIIIYVLLYYFLVYQFIIKGYNEGVVNKTYIENFKYILEHNYFFILLLIFACFRFIRIVFFHEKKYLLTDSLLFASSAYLFAFVLLKLNMKYYFTPIYILALPAFFVFFISLKRNVAALLCFILIFGFGYKNYHSDLISSVQNIQSARKNDMNAVDLLCEKINNGYEVYYFQVKNIKPENAFDNVIMGYWRDIAEAFVSFRLGHEYKFKVVDTLFPLTDKQILISSALTTKEQSVDFAEMGFVSNFLMYSNMLTVYEKCKLQRLSLPILSYFSGINKDIRYVGLYTDEEGGRWGSACVRIVFNVKNDENIHININAIPFIAENFPINTGKVYVNDVFLREWKFDKWEMSNLEFIIPQNLFNADGSVVIKLVSNNLLSPEELGIGADIRKLGLMFHSISIDKE